MFPPPDKPMVLWIEDDPSVVRRYERDFSERGIEVISPNSIGDALSKANDPNNHFTAIICDLYFDDFQKDDVSNGLRFVESLRKNGNDTPIFAYSAFSQSLNSDLNTEQFSQIYEKTSFSKHSSNQLIDAILGFSAQKSDPKEKDEPRIIQLDPIDYALYQAIQENPELLKTLHWRAFEELLADILKTLGYEVELMCGTKDGGVDIIALANNTDFGPHKYLLQAKRYAHSVGVAPVRELMFLQNHHHASKSCLATTAEFTIGAWELAHQYPWQLELRDYQGLREWIDAAIRVKQK